VLRPSDGTVESRWPAEASAPRCDRPALWADGLFSP
jgi:hypothetical protein